MILKAKERGDAGQLARYLLAMRDNEHVELHEVSGFVSDDLIEAFSEADAIAKGTRCKNYLFSMSLNPPEGADVPTKVPRAVPKNSAMLLPQCETLSASWRYVH